ncbi:MAG: nucleotide exchange factor GrpE [Chitinophagaceae bacterium]|nr:nucleotide exchange factor GrpE [Chitinophagaceae bacterium]
MDNTQKEATEQSEMQIDINTDENVAGTSHLKEEIAEEDQVSRLNTEIGELKDKYLRQAAEFDNFRKRSSKERMELIQTAGKDVIVSLLEVLDDTERAEKQIAAAQDVQAIKDGVQLVFQKLRKTMHAKGLKPMETAGLEFNPDIHEAITEIPAGDDLKGKVVDEVEKGYYLNDKIIRFAKVVVGK